MEAGTPSILAARQHIQDHDAAESVIHHWGYADRVVPCVNDPGSCTYLDVVYGAHDVGMVYTGILWASIGGILLIWALVRRALPPLSARHQQHQAVADAGQAEAADRKPEGTVTRLRHALWAHLNRFFLPDMWRPVFGRTTRLQVTILAVFVGYLAIFSFCGIVYGIWITPVKDHPGLYNTRSSLGPFSDRVGVLAYALTPLSVMLANRESLLSVLTGIPYQNFNFLHRWLGYVIVLQSVVHTIGWSIIEIRLYQPQPQVAKKWIVQLYMIWGLVAMILLLMLYVLSLPPVIRLTGYEFFRKAHYVLAMVYIGACIGHWEQLQCFLIPGILLWFFDRAARLARTFLIHYNFVDGAQRGFVAAHAAVTTFPDAQHGDVVRLDFEHPHEAWHPGQHFYLCFSESSIFQSHPFTPLNAPETVNGRTKHSYIFRAKKGETKKVAQLAAKKVAQLAAKKIADGAGADGKAPTTPVILTGPYGDAITRNVTPDANILCIAGGTGITYVLPALLSIKASEPSRKLELVWVVRHAKDADWVQQELDTLADKGVTVRIFATRDAAAASPSPEPSSDGVAGDDEKHAGARVNKVSSSPSSLRSNGVGHPDVALLVRDFLGSTESGRTMVFASGPGGLMSDARAAVASQNSGVKVWKGDDKFNVDFIFDERMER